MMLKFALLGLLFMHSLVASELKCLGDESLEKINTIPNYQSNSRLRDGAPTKQLVIDSELQTRWYEPNGEIKSIAIVLHGLNFRADYMGQVIKILNDQGAKVLNIAMPGFREAMDPKTGKKVEQIEILQPLVTHNMGVLVSSSVYFNDRLKDHPERNLKLSYIHKNILESYCVAKKEAQKLKVDLIFSGFSMGATAMISLMNSPDTIENVEFDKMLLFAPAFLGYKLNNLVKILGGILPNANVGGRPQDWSYNPTYTISNFGPGLEANDIIHEYGIKKSNIPTLLIINPDDIAVSLKKINQLVDSDVPLWNVRFIQDWKSSKKNKHIAVMEEYSGSYQWESIQRDIKDLLEN